LIIYSIKKISENEKENKNREGRVPPDRNRGLTGAVGDSGKKRRKEICRVLSFRKDLDLKPLANIQAIPT
jgi:hypothetical protein